ncbi:MAG TPA: helix-turn-helix transcriptional regulator [Terriglobia bacterium]|nr:helix-turn-helix transcriptional regulator [Terriglobia bacterium]
MQIGKKLRALRLAKGLSQGDIERRCGLLRSYISRVEGGYTSPTLQTLEKFAESMGMEAYQILYPDSGHPHKPPVNSHPPISESARKLVKLFDGMSRNDRKLLLTLAAKLAKG